MEILGLSEEEARRRLSRYGRNELKKEKEPGLLLRFLDKLADPLIYILLVAAAVSFLLREISDAFIILTVVLLNGIIGMIQEGKAKRALEGLEKLTAPHCRVVREGKQREIPGSELVPGDVVVLEAGNWIPADCKLLTSVNLKVDEASLSGESVPVEKDAGERAWMSTYVTYGRAQAEVTATGMDTRIGRIAGMVSAAPTEATPLQKRLQDLGKVLSILAVGLCVLLFLIAVLQHRPVGEMLITAISLAVAAVPEGLPAVVTIVLALSVSQLVRVNTIVKRLPSVETLGCVSVVCSDKTGTLTQNRMEVTRCFTNGRECAPKELNRGDDIRFLEGFVLCNDATLAGETAIGDPTELALLQMGRRAGLSQAELSRRFVRVAEIPFASETKRMTTLHRHEGRYVEYMKGAPGNVLAVCDRVWRNKRAVPMTRQFRVEIEAANSRMSSQALRVLAVAMKETSELEERGLIFLGLAGMLDPIRPEAVGAIQEFLHAGVRTVMITGDNPQTAAAIGKQLGLCTGDEREIISAEQLSRLSDEELQNRIEDTRVFARVAPEDKCRIVRAFQEKGQIVAMTGDGTNDAPSLKIADIGIAMGRGGTDVARSAADFILTDDNFATIRDAISEGRSIYENIKKSVVFLLSSNFGEIITMLAAVIAGIATPLKPSHILWINLITDSLPALALGCDSNDKSALMRRPPRRPEESLFAHGGMLFTCFYGLLIAAISLGAFLFLPIWILAANGAELSLASIRYLLGQKTVLLHAQTYAFTVLGLSQLFHAVGMRDVRKSLFQMNHADNPMMFAALFVGIGLQVLVTEVPVLVGAFQTAKLTLEEWGVLVAISMIPMLFHELLVLLRYFLNFSQFCKKKEV